jgi:adenine-specific DNA-methyltransferase
MTSQKLRGGYYTPQIISDFLTQWALENKGTTILEPSCGDGVFLESVFKLGNPTRIKEILAIEYESLEAKKVEKMIKDHPSFRDSCNVITGDFFEYYNKHLKNKKFDVVLGNPPYIRYQFFEEKQRDEALKIMGVAGIKSNKLANIWAAFLIAGIMSLKNHGRLGMVIPGEMLHVNYSNDVRQYMSKFPGKITIITFQELVFPDVQQEILLVMIEKNDMMEHSLQNQLYNASINMVQLKNIDSLKNYDFSDLSPSKYKKVEPTNEKWTRYLLSKEELNELKKISTHPKIKRLGNLACVDVGTVTGANKYFVVAEDVIKEYELDSISLPLVGRSTHIDGVIFGKADWMKNKRKGVASHLLKFPDESLAKYTKKMKKYVELGEKNGIQNGYKTGIRDRWYQVPSIWSPDAFLLRRSHKFPKLILNVAKAHTTDTMHRVKLREGTDPSSLIFCFYNSITMAYSELVGRNHGGGVLEILPNDAEEILIPYQKCEKKHLTKIDEMMRDNVDVEKILDYVDKVILLDNLGLSKNTVDTFRSIWRKLSNRRHARKIKVKTISS